MSNNVFKMSDYAKQPNVAQVKQTTGVTPPKPPVDAETIQATKPKSTPLRIVEGIGALRMYDEHKGKVIPYTFSELKHIREAVHFLAENAVTPKLALYAKMKVVLIDKELADRIK